MVLEEHLDMEDRVGDLKDLKIGRKKIHRFVDSRTWQAELQNGGSQCNITAGRPRIILLRYF